MKFEFLCPLLRSVFFPLLPVDCRNALHVPVGECTMPYKWFGSTDSAVRTWTSCTLKCFLLCFMCCWSVCLAYFMRSILSCKKHLCLLLVISSNCWILISMHLQAKHLNFKWSDSSIQNMENLVVLNYFIFVEMLCGNKFK